MTEGRGSVVGSAVTEGVGRIPGFVNSYVFQEGDETFVIDAGLRRKAPAIVAAFRAAQVPLTTVRRILITHHHVDHRGGAAYLLENSRAPVACHVDDAPYVDGQAKAPMSLLMRLFVHVRPVPVATVLHEGDRVGPLVVVHVPGHTPGEVAFYHPSRKLLFSGDSVVEHEGHLTLPAPRYATDLDQAVRSLSRLRALDTEVLLPGHGEPVTQNVLPLLDDLIRRAPEQFGVPSKRT